MNDLGNSKNGETLCARIIVLGDPGVGKTTLIRNFTSGRPSFSQNSKSPVSDISERTWNLADGRKVKMTILDTGGLERYRSITSSHYRGIHGCLIVFNVTKLSSFESVSMWIKDLRHYTADQHRISTILVGTTQESPQRVVSTEKAIHLAKYLELPYIEVSLQEDAATTVFQNLAVLIFERFQKRCSVVSLTTENIKLSEHKQSRCSCTK